VTEIENVKSISLKGEILRKLTHLGAFVVPGSYYFLKIPEPYILSILSLAWLIIILIEISRFRNWKLWDYTKWFMAPMLRDSELKGDNFSGAFYILPAMIASILFFDPPVTLISLSFIIFGDPASAIFGRRYGKHKFKNKSLEGSTAFLIFAVAVAIFAPEIPLWIALLGAVTATITEALSFEVDDNVTVPLISGLVITLLMKISASI